MQGLLSLYGWYYQSNTAKFNPPLYLFHHCFSLTLTSWPLCSGSQKRLCEGELQEDWEIWQKISEKCSEGVTAASVYFGLTTFALEIGHRIAASVVSPWSAAWAWIRGKVHRTSLWHRDRWPQLGSLSTSSPSRHFAVDLFPQSSERAVLVLTNPWASRCCYVQLSEKT